MQQQHMDILDERDSLTLPFIGSLVLHGCLLAVGFLSWFWMKETAEPFGDPHPSGGQAYAVSPTKTIPIPQKEAPPNPVAHDTDSLVPTAPAVKEEKKPPPPMVPPPLDAFQIPDKLKPQKQPPQQKQNYQVPAPPNQVYARTPQAVSNPMYSAPQTGAGQVGIGPNSLLGNRFGAYAEIIRERLAQSWQTNGLNSRAQNAPAVVSFHIQRDGSIHGVQLVQYSGNLEIDHSAVRAVTDCNPFPRFPPQITDNDILAEFTFNLR